MSALPKYRLTTVPTATPAALGSGAIRVMKLAIAGGSAASKVELKNAATDTGDVLLTVNALTNDFKEIDFSDVGGIAFSTGCFVKPAGTAALVYVWWEPMQSQSAFA
jgi:hypothetical protein